MQETSLEVFIILISVENDVVILEIAYARSGNIFTNLCVTGVFFVIIYVKK